MGIEQPRKADRVFCLSRKISHLCVVHHHLRPGGVRRIIELALPHLLKNSPIQKVTLAVGESKDPRWISALEATLGGLPLAVRCEPAFRYASEQRSSPVVIRRKISAALQRLAPDPEETLFWVHNPGLARNVMLTDELRRFASTNHTSLIFHHHDFWFENRWSRWAELRGRGFRSLDAVAEAIFAAGAPAVHATINRSDAGILARHPALTSAWMPNLASRQKPCSRAEKDRAARWLAKRLGDRGPVWIFPTRFLRRKNLGEAVLLTRWLRPEGWLVTTAGVSSAEEAAYARRLEAAAKSGGWRARFRLLENEDDAPSIPALMAASEAVVLTSAQEGFGLPYLEAAAAGRPLIARRLPNVVPDLETFGFRLPWLYDEVLIDASLLDGKKERARQAAAWREWQAEIPRALRPLAGRPAVLELPEGSPLPFSRLTLAGQLEVLAQPPEAAWDVCEFWNPRLAYWKDQITRGAFRVPAWPRRAEATIGGPAYARRFWKAVHSPSRPAAEARDCHEAQRDFIRERLGSSHLYPILFSAK
jgi:glycosyltransferase involved in cell wall biosynthesis